MCLCLCAFARLWMCVCVCVRERELDGRVSSSSFRLDKLSRVKVSSPGHGNWQMRGESRYLFPSQELRGPIHFPQRASSLQGEFLKKRLPVDQWHLRFCMFVLGQKKQVCAVMVNVWHFCRKKKLQRLWKYDVYISVFHQDQHLAPRNAARRGDAVRWRSRPISIAVTLDLDQYRHRCPEAAEMSWLLDSE